MAFTPEELEYLNAHGFDLALFESWQRGLRDGTLSRASNAVRSELRPPELGSVAKLPPSGSREHEALREEGLLAIQRGELGVVILNGGMATRFGGVVKGVVDVLGPGRSFLGLAIEDVARWDREAGGRIQIFLMNSFATDEATKAHLLAHGHFGFDPSRIAHFEQFVSVRMLPNGEVYRAPDGKLSLYGPGHGDFAPAFRKSGMLRRFLDGGGRHLLVRNVDNLGARVDPAVLGYHLECGKQATVEVAPKWPGDVGGSPFVLDGKLQLVEQIRYPEGFQADVVDVFNTNTFTFAAEALDADFELGWYFVAKEVDEQRVVQVEHLIGEMTRHLDCSFLQVRRSGRDSRFLPIKTPEDLESARDEIAEMYSDSPAEDG
ncbi:MAG: hypothetical protein Fur0037_18070 [Planctomycetota bacterium]